MSQFYDFNAENKLRIPLSAYAAQIIEDDCYSFQKKKTTLINSIIFNSYQNADCSISLRMDEYRNELASHFNGPSKRESEIIIEKIVSGKANELVKRYARRFPSDVNWQITLSKRVKELLTEDPHSSEENYYGHKPGHFVRALLEEYARHPYYLREEIVFKPIIDVIKIAIEGQHGLYLTNSQGNRFSIKPFCIKTDPLSMFHYLIGYSSDYQANRPPENESKSFEVVSLRVSRLASAEIHYLSSGKITDVEKAIISKELDTKGVQFVTSDASIIKVWLSDAGIRKYRSQAHLRPSILYKDPADDHIVYFECTDAQILFYFFDFGMDAKILEPVSLAERFKSKYKDAFDSYNEDS